MIGLETQKQMEMAGESPDFIIGAWAGVRTTRASPIRSWPLTSLESSMHVRGHRAGRLPHPDRVSSLRLRRHGGDVAHRAHVHPGAHRTLPAPVHAGGLEYRSDAPSLSMLVKHGHMEARAYTQNQVFDAGVQFCSRTGDRAGPGANPPSGR